MFQPLKTEKLFCLILQISSEFQTKYASFVLICILEKNITGCKITFLHPVEYSRVQESEMFEELQNELQKIYNYRQKLLTLPLEELI